MNPELVRTLWLEFTPRRLGLIVASVVLVILAVALTVDGFRQPEVALAAEALFFLAAIVIGARDAAMSLVGEIRDRTWDQQRLSAIGPWAMVWGKLAGSTATAWCGGVLCLAVLVPHALRAKGTAAALIGTADLVLLALLAQGLALLASLAAARRRTTLTRLEGFGFQGLGIAGAALLDFALPGPSYWDQPLASLTMPEDPGMTWWGLGVAGTDLHLVSLACAAAWTLVGCVRLMRRELQVENGPVVWLGFLAFVALYVAGLVEPAARLAMAFATLGTIVYAMVLIEPKDRVLYRWLIERWRAGAAGVAIARAQGWMHALAATLAVGLVLVATRATTGAGGDSPEYGSIWKWVEPGSADGIGVLAALGFLLRDCAVVVGFSLWRQRGADVAAIVALMILYVLAPMIAGAIGTDLLGLFLPVPSGWIAPVAAWVQALVAWTALARATSIAGTAG